MKIKVNKNPANSETEVQITSAASDERLKELVQLIQGWEATTQTIWVKKRDSNYQLSLTDILFFETNDRIVVAHTVTDIFQTDYRLYELDDLLPATFFRVAKSTIVNLNQVYSLTKTLTGNVVAFQDSHKEIFVSRRYYKELKRLLIERSSLS